MGRHEKDWDDTLQKLRNQNSNSEIADLIREVVQNLTEADLNDPAGKEIYANRVKLHRGKRGMTLKEVGRYLDVSHPCIQKQEQPSKSKDTKFHIDRHYLEAFSLLYEVSPLYLLGKVNDENLHSVPSSEDCKYSPVSLIYAASQDVIDRIKLIITVLHDPKSNDIALDRELFDVFLSLTKTTQAARDRIIKILQLTPIVERAKDAFDFKDPLKDIADKWMRFLVYNIPERNQLVNWQNSFLYLGNRDTELLNMMSYISVADYETKNVISTYLGKGGFLDQPRAFRQFAGSQNLQ